LPSIIQAIALRSWRLSFATDVITESDRHYGSQLLEVDRDDGVRTNRSTSSPRCAHARDSRPWRGWDRTHTHLAGPRILSPVRLRVPPPRRLVHRTERLDSTGELGRDRAATGDLVL